MSAWKTGMLRMFGRDWVLTTLGLYDPEDLAVSDTIPCGPPDGCDPIPDSAPPVPAELDDSDEWLVFGGGK